MPPDLVQQQAHEHQGTRSSSRAKNSTKPGMLLPRPCTCLYDDREVADAAAGTIAGFLFEQAAAAKAGEQRVEEDGG